MQILRVLLRTAPHCLEARHIEQLAGCTHGFVGADLQLLVKESALQALRRWRNSPQGVCVHVCNQLHYVWLIFNQLSCDVRCPARQYVPCVSFRRKQFALFDNFDICIANVALSLLSITEVAVCCALASALMPEQTHQPCIN
jgi:SpoVK/Ycf46/Vps4 family AAA+-type ATPase